MRDRESRTPKVLAVASGGGHWVQLLRLLPALDGLSTVFASVGPDAADQVPDHRYYPLPDATRWSPGRLAILSLAITRMLLKERPQAILTTGAAHGYLALRIGKRFGARTIWLDSIANVQELSLSGQKVAPYADMWLTQWPDLAEKSHGGMRSPEFRGRVL